jgi:hypothetical protein
MQRFMLSAIFAIGLAGSASAQSTPAGAPAAAVATPDTGASPAPAADPTDSDDLVTCRYEKTTGSNFTKRICHTRRDWARQSQDAHDTLERLDSGSVGGSQPNAGGG